MENSWKGLGEKCEVKEEGRERETGGGRGEQKSEARKKTREHRREEKEGREEGLRGAVNQLPLRLEKLQELLWGKGSGYLTEDSGIARIGGLSHGGGCVKNREAATASLH